MRILHIIQRYPPAIGGSEVWCQKTARALSEKGHRVTVLTLNVYNEDEYWEDPGEDNHTLSFGCVEYDGLVKVIRCQRTKISRIFLIFSKFAEKGLKAYLYGPHSLSMYKRMFVEIKRTDLVHLHTLPYPHNIVGLIIAKLFRKKIALTPHFHIGHKHYELWLNYWIMKNCDVVFTVTQEEKDYLIKKNISPQRLVVAYNCIDTAGYEARGLDELREELTKTCGITEKTKVITFLGRKIDYKGIDTLIEAFRRVRKEIPVKLFLIGPNFPWFDKLYAGLSEEERVDIIDFGVVSQQKKVNLLHLSNVLVLPSQFEAFGIVFLEAWACNCPVIGAKSVGAAKAVQRGGLLFNNQDAGDLAEKIRLLLNNNDLAAQFAIAGKKMVNCEYSQEKVGEIILNAYRSLLKKRLRVMIVSNLFPPYFHGGAEIFAYKQARELSRMGNEVSIFCGKLDKSARLDEVRREKPFNRLTRVNLHSMDIQYAHKNTFVTSIFRRELFEFAPDIVHFHNIPGLPLQLVDECHRLRIPSVMTLHDFWPICSKNTLLTGDGEVCPGDDALCLSCDNGNGLGVRNSRIRESLEKVSLFISPSSYLASLLIKRGFPESKIKVINYGTDLILNRKQFESPVEQKRFRFGYVGYMGKHKGIEFLIKAFALAKSNGSAKLALYLSDYDNKYLDSVNLLAKMLMVDNDISFIHKTPNNKISRAYKHLDALILPSVWPENLPLSICEAMAYGLPVIASDIGGIPELVKDRVTGLLFKPKDIRQLSDCMKSLINSPEVAKRMGEKGYYKIMAQGIDKQTRIVLGKYRELIGAS